MADSIVYAPQQPSVFDKDTRVWVATVSFAAAERFGEVRVMMPPNMSNMMVVPMVEALKEKMANYQEQDYLLAVGDPTLIACAAGIALKKTQGTLRLLKWDRNARDYVVAVIKI